MKRSLKFITLSITAVLCFVMSIVIALGSNVALAESTFKINEGFSIRTTAPDGLRVTTTVANKIEGATYGTLMLPESMCEDIDLAFNEDGTLNENILNIVTAQFNADGVSYNSVLAAEKDEQGQDQAFPESFYNVPITVRGYCIDGENITYTENTVTRSMAFTAVSAYVNGFENDIAEKSAKEIVINGVAVGEEVQAKLFIGNVDASVSDKITVTFSADTDVANVSADGKVTAIKGGTFTLTATVSGEGEEEIVVTKEISIPKEVIAVSTKYDYGINNQETLFIKSSDLSAVPVKAMVGETEVEITAVDGGYQVDGSAFTSTGVKTLVVETAYTVENVKVNCVTAVIRTLTDLQSMATYATDNKANFVLANDIDCGGYTFGAGTQWSDLVFDGRGYVVSNFKLAQSNGLFGNKILAGIVKNLAIKGFSAVSHYTGGICTTFGAATLENIYASGSVPGTVAQTSLLVLTTDASSTFKNILVNVEDSQRADASAITRLSTVNADNVNSYQATNFTNVYSIDNSANNYIKHVAYSYKSGTSILYAGIPSVTGGYGSLGAFVADKENIFKNGFEKVFSIENDANGVPVIKFLGRTVGYTISNVQDKDLVLNASDFAGEVSSVTLADGTALTSAYSIDGNNNNVIVPIANFATAGNYVLKVTTTENAYLVAVKVIDAIIIKDLQGLKDMTSSAIEKFVLMANIDCNATNFGSGKVWSSIDFDGQGFTVSNFTTAASNGLFGAKIYGKIRNLAITNASPNGNFAGVLARYLYGTLENIYVSGSITTGIAQSSLLVAEVTTSATVKNVLVNVENCTRSDAMAIGKHSGASGADYKVTNIANAYSIDNSANKKIKHVAYSYKEGTSVKFANITSATGAYTDGAAFLADKDTIFTGAFANVFSLGTDGTNTTLQFLGRTVKTF